MANRSIAKTTRTGIGPVSSKWLKGARMYHRLLKSLEDSVPGREALFIEREHRGRRAFQNVFMKTLLEVQEQDHEVQAGFAAMVGDLMAVSVDGWTHEATEVGRILRTAEIRA